MSFFANVFTLLTTPPGNLIYHLVLAFSIAGALQGAISQWRSTEFPQARRMILGFSVLLLAQLLLFGASALAWQNVITPEQVLPPLDRAVILFSLVWVAWLWAFPEPLRSADAATLLLSLLVGAGLALSLISWMQTAPGVFFNATNHETIWSLFSMGFTLLAAIVLVARRPNSWGQGIAFLFLAFTGELVDFIYPMNANFGGATRLALMIAFPILLSLPNRFPTVAASSQPAPVPVTSIVQSPDKPFRERRRYSTDPKTLHALLMLASETNVQNIHQAIARASAQAMLADLCFLILIGDEKKNLFIATGYDLIREEYLPGTQLSKDAVPLLANAVLRGRPLRLPASSTSSDLRGLGEVLGLSNPGHLLNIPIGTEKGPLGSILLLSPYSNRLWSADDQSFLANITASFIPVLERTKRIDKLEQERDTALSANQASQQRLVEIEKQNEQLSIQLEAVQEVSEENQQQAENLAALLALQEESQALISQLRSENEKLRTSPVLAGVPAPTGNMEQIESELRLTLSEVAQLQNALAEAEMKILELEKSKPAREHYNEHAEVIASISQELRQPMSSLVGYTDLLLGESVGILGALQRKFIERVKTSTERIGSLIDDLIQISVMDSNLINLNPEPVDLNLIIDNAMAYTSSQLREKDISLLIDMPKDLAQIQADREAMQQILIHLLQNAGAASPVEGVVTLRVRMESEDGQDYVLVQVTDSGGGIPKEDLPRVFSRLYRAENVLIQGVGDTGVGLSIAKALTEAQHGRIWVETEMGSGSTFSVLLPINSIAQAVAVVEGD